jgi:hypothetical protein
LECAGSARDPPKVVDQVRFLARALFGTKGSPRVCRAHGGLRSRKAGSDSLAGDWAFFKSSECDGFAYDPAKVEDQVQFLARTFTATTLEPDGQATGCNPVLVGSTPTGVFMSIAEIGDNAREFPCIAAVIPKLMWQASVDLCYGTRIA